jgi:hypothetical protein
VTDYSKFFTTPGEMSIEAHAAKARANAKAAGAHDCIHFAPEWRSRSERLYEAAKEAYESHGVHYWEGPAGANPYLLKDGRMVVVCNTIWFVEVK